MAYLVPREEDSFPVIARELPGETLVPNEDLIATIPYSKLPGIVPAPEMPPIFLGAPPPAGSGPIPPPPVQPPVVPEPDTFSLTLIGLGASTLASRWRKRR